MPRKKKKQKLNVNSSETKIFFGLILFVASLALIIAPLTGQQATIFIYISNFLGWPSIAWGISLGYLSIFLLTRGKKFSNWTRFIGLTILSISLNTLFTYWIPKESLESSEGLAQAGGELGKSIHLAVNNRTGDLLEIIILIIVLVVAFSLTTSVKLEEIIDVLQQFFGNLKFGWLKNISPNVGGYSEEKDIKISGLNEEILENENTASNIEDFEINENTNIEPIQTTGGTLQTGQQGMEFANNTENTTDDMTPQTPRFQNWRYPGTDLLQDPKTVKADEKIYRELGKVIEQTLKSFGIQSNVIKASIGPTVVQYSLSLAVGVKVAKIKNLNNDIALATKSSNVRIEAPIPGTSYVGVEIPNPTPNYVYLKEMARRLFPQKENFELPLILGKDIAGQTIIKDLVKIPHILVAGATGTGKSVGINTILAGLLLTKTPDEVKFIMIDPKMGVEMAAYNGIPHLLNPVITDSELVVNALQWTIGEMMKRYKQLKQAHVKKLVEYNKAMGYTAMPYIVVVIDEMADLMITAGVEVESKIQRLAQMGRAVGIHLILATQKPTVNVITGLIKSNIPGRIAYAVATAMDSRVILDQTGADNLLGNGDLLFKDQTMPKAIRVQCAFTSTEDTEYIISQIKDQVPEDGLEYSNDLTQAIEQAEGGQTGTNGTEREPEFEQALDIVIAEGKASASFLQRRLRIGYNKAARLMDNLEQAGVIGKSDGSSKARDLLITSKAQIMGQQDDPTQTM
jgi:S-DNA-T family DNA segregation ATPase FtsK/SpoIIIE